MFRPRESGVAEGRVAMGEGGRGAVPAADHTAARSLAVLLQTLQTSPACELSPLPATQSAFAA